MKRRVAQVRDARHSGRIITLIRCARRRQMVRDQCGHLAPSVRVKLSTTPE
jgi:hypothetical protein